MAEVISGSQSAASAEQWSWRKNKWRSRKPCIWFVDDCAEDHTLVERAVDGLCDVRYFQSGAEFLRAVTLLADDRATSEHAGPDLVLLDYRMPNLPGVETLLKLRSLPAAGRTPVIIFSSSSAQDDISASYTAGCNSFVTKPSGWREYRHTIRSILRYWLDVSA